MIGLSLKNMTFNCTSVKIQRYSLRRQEPASFRVHVGPLELSQTAKSSLINAIIAEVESRGEGTGHLYGLPTNQELGQSEPTTHQ
jgi:hypothetical protein